MKVDLGIALGIALLGCDTPHGASTTTQPVVEASAVVATPIATPIDAQASPPTVASTPDAIVAQHVLVTYRGAKRAPKTVTRSKTEAKARAAEALGKLRAGAAFEDVVRGYSDDISTIDRMGSLGKFRRDAMDPTFASAAFALAVGAVSDVVETPFGFHILRRTQ